MAEPPLLTRQQTGPTVSYADFTNGESRGEGAGYISHVHDRSGSIVQRPSVTLSRSQVMRSTTAVDVARSSMYIAHPTNYLETLMNMIRIYVGNGLFAMPFAFKCSGLFFGVGLVVSFMIATVYSNHVLINCCDEVRKRGNLRTFPDMPQTIYLSFISGPPCFRPLGKAVRSSVTVSIVAMQFLICCVTIVFVGNSFKLLLENYHVPKVHMGIYLAVVTIPMLLTSLIKELKYLSPISFIANIFLVIGVFIVLFITCENLPRISARPAIAPVDQIPIFFGTFLFAVAGVSMTIPFRSQMSIPEHFDSPLGVLNLSMLLYGFLLVLIGFVGYLQYGDESKGSVILNLPPTKISVQVVQFAIALSIMFSYALQFYLVHLLIFSFVDEKFGPFGDCFELCLRILLVTLSLICAEVIPSLGLLISMSGALTCSALLFVFPQLSDIALRWPKRFGCLGWRFIVDVFLIILAFFCLVLGLYTSLVSFIKQKK